MTRDEPCGARSDVYVSRSSLQKYVPRFKRDANAVPSFRLYSQRDIMDTIPGEGNHTFNRAFAPVDDAKTETTESQAVSSSATCASLDAAASSPTSHEQPGPRLADEFCRIMVHDKAHLSPPKELWTRHNIAQLDANIGRPVPLFQESGAKKHSFEFLGWYRIVQWELCKGKSGEVQAFVSKRKVSQIDKPREYWVGALGQDWARVELAKVSDASLGNPMERHAS